MRLTVWLSAAALVLSACKSEDKETRDAAISDGDAGAPGGLSRAQLVNTLASCLNTGVTDFRERAMELETAVAAWAAGPSPATTMAAREAFRRANEAWQINEVLQVGPAAAGTDPGGQYLREGIYSWPLVSACEVDKELAAKGYEAATFGNAAVNRRGLAALEYLLHEEGASSRCPSPPPGWDALTAEERAGRRRAYAAAAAADLERQAVALANAWAPNGFHNDLQTAGPGNKYFPSATRALNAVMSAALVYVDTRVKDRKLAQPLGLRDCASTTCPDDIEAPFAALSKANQAQNLIGFRRIAEGCEANFGGPGFDDLLVAVGAEAMAVRLRERTSAVQAALVAIEEPDLRAALAADAASVRSLHTAWKGITDLLKTELLTALNLELPPAIGTDND